MNKLKILTISVVGLVLLNLGLITTFFIGPPKHHNGPKHVIIEKLDFSKAQILDFEQLISEHSISVQLLSENIRSVKEELYKTILTNDKHKEKESLEKIGQLKEDIELLHLQHFKDIELLCSTEQKVKFKDLIKDFNKMFAPRPMRR